VQTKKKYLNLILLCLLLIISFGFNTKKHPFYLSVTELTINSQLKEVALSCKIFTDDLQLGLHQMHNKPINLEKHSRLNDSLLAIFARKNLQVFVGNKPVLFTYLGYEIIEEAVWFYLEGALPKGAISEVRVQNNVLCNVITSQSNLVHCTLNKMRQSHKLNCPEKEFVFKF
jgi:hypothetical protein